MLLPNRSLILFLLIFISFNVAAAEFKPKVVALISFKSKIKNAVEDLAGRYEKYLQKYYDREKFDIEVVANANQYDLWKHIKSPQTVSLFWFSHSKLGIEGVTQSSIKDSDGNNTLDVFEHAGPNLKFLAVLSCFAKDILKDIKFPDGLKTFLPDKKFYPTNMFKKAVKASSKIDFEYMPKISDIDMDVSNVTVTIKRSNLGDKDLLPEKIYVGRKLITILPPLPRDKTFSQDIYLSIPEDYTTYDLKIVSRLIGEKKSFSRKSYNFEELEFSISGEIDGEWKIFADKLGEPFGIGYRIFRFYC